MKLILYICIFIISTFLTYTIYVLCSIALCNYKIRRLKYIIDFLTFLEHNVAKMPDELYMDILESFKKISIKNNIFILNKAYNIIQINMEDNSNTESIFTPRGNPFLLAIALRNIRSQLNELNV